MTLSGGWVGAMSVRESDKSAVQAGPPPLQTLPGADTPSEKGLLSLERLALMHDREVIERRCPSIQNVPNATFRGRARAGCKGDVPGVVTPFAAIGENALLHGDDPQPAALGSTSRPP